MQLQKANGAMDLFRRAGMHAMQSKGREEVHPQYALLHFHFLCEIKIRFLFMLLPQQPLWNHPKAELERDSFFVPHGLRWRE